MKHHNFGSGDAAVGPDVQKEAAFISGTSRREFLKVLAAVGAGSIVPASGLIAQIASPGSATRRIDIHHHFASPRWLELVAAIRFSGYQNFLGYTPAKAIEAMDKAGVSTAIISAGYDLARGGLISPGDLARDLNDYGAKLVSDHKGRFGLFGVLPLPDIAGSLKEIEYVFDTLQADGVGIRTSYGNKWLGDRFFQPVFEELNRRKAVVYTHPIDAPCCQDLMPGVAGTTIEYNTDTSRAIFSMINDGGGGAQTTSMATRYADITFIWSHAGGSLLGLVGRFLGSAASGENLTRPAPQNSRLYHLRRFYYDTAASANPVQMQAMKVLVGASQIVFGSDFPFGNPPIVSIVQGLETCGLSAEELRGIYRENALRFLPAKYKT